MFSSNSRALRVLPLGLLTLLATTSQMQAQLSPPPGPVAPSMKRLDQVEPRRIVNSLAGSATAVHVIDQPGNYVVTTDITGVDGKSGIEITCDGSVVLDLNGFSLEGVPGSLHGVHVRDAGSGLPTGRRTFAMSPHMHQLGRISSWGGDGLNLNNLDVCDVDGLTILDCGGAACRAQSHDRAMNSIRNIKAFDCGGGGVLVDVSAVAQAGALGAGKVSYSDLSVMRCAGDGAHVRVSSSSTCDVGISSSTFNSCSGHGVFVEAVAGAAGGGLGAGKVSMSDLSIMRCSGDGVRCECASGWSGSDCSLERVAVGDVDGDGIHVTGDWDGDCTGCGVTRCGGAGLHIEGSSAALGTCRVSLCSFSFCARGVDASHGSEIHLSDVSCTRTTNEGFVLNDYSIADSGPCPLSFCGGDGITARRIGKFKAGSDLAKRSSITACGGHGLSTEDCNDVTVSGLDVSFCTLDGISHTWTQVDGPFRLAHEAAHVAQCRAGLRISCPPESVTLDVGCRRSSFSGNTESGVVIDCPGPGLSIIGVDIVDLRCAFNGGTGIEVRAHASSSVTCACSHLLCIHNGGDGLSVTSTDPALTLAGGALSLESSVCSSNTGMGCRCTCALDANGCSFSENSASGVDCRVASSFDSGGSLSDCTLHRNALHGARCGPGRYSGVACDVSDNGSDGLRCESGCLIADRCLCNRNGGDGLHVSGTLTVSGGAMRRNGGGGIRCFDGTCSIADCVAELNGANPGVTGGGMLFDGCSSVSLQRCMCNNNTGPGMRCTSSSGALCAWSSSDCMCSSNTLEGMSLDACPGGQVLRCSFSNNSAWGLECLTGFNGGKVDACSCTGNGGGILVEGVDNLVISNSCTMGPIGSLSVLQPLSNTVGRVLTQAQIQQGACDARGNMVH